MEKKTKHFDMRLTETENRALEAMAKRENISKTQVLVNYITRQAKRLGLWGGDIVTPRDGGSDG